MTIRSGGSGQDFKKFAKSDYKMHALDNPDIDLEDPEALLEDPDPPDCAR